MRMPSNSSAGKPSFPAAGCHTYLKNKSVFLSAAIWFLKRCRIAAEKTTDSRTWSREMLAIARKAMSEERIEEAIAYRRMAEFFMYDGDPEKIMTYDKAIELFYDH